MRSSLEMMVKINIPVSARNRTVAFQTTASQFTSRQERIPERARTQVIWKNSMAFRLIW